MTTGIYQKINGVWTVAQRPYVKLSGAWTPVTQAYRKTSGVWTKFYEFDNTPSAAPSIRLDYVGPQSAYGSDWANANFIIAFVKLPGSVNDPDLKMIRVLTTYAGAAPTTQFGGTYTSAASNTHPEEPWSDFYYNSWTSDGYFPEGKTIELSPGVFTTEHVYSESRDSHVELAKEWPRGAGTETKLPAGRYYFTAWSQDMDGNWSASSPSYIDLPAWSFFTPAMVTTDQYFYITESGTYVPGGGTGGAGGTWTAGKMTQSATGPKHGYSFYGDQIINAVQVTHFSSPSTSVAINSAQVQVRRGNDTGEASANLWMGLHGYTSPTGLESTSLKVAGEFSSDVINCGTIAKGESKWINVPADWIRNSLIRGFKFWHKDPNVVSAVAADYSELTGIDEAPQAMQLHLNMTQNYSHYA